MNEDLMPKFNPRRPHRPGRPIVPFDYDPQDPDRGKPRCADCGERIYSKQSGNGWTHNPDRFR